MGVDFFSPAMRLVTLATAALLALSVLITTGNAQATTRAVNSTADSGGSCPATCTLRAAVSASGAGDTINFDPAVFSAPRTITLTAGEIAISHAGGMLTITGPGANLLTISGNNASRIFAVASTVPLTTFVLSGVTISAGLAHGGGGILSDGNLTLSNCVIAGNNAGTGTGGGVYQAGGLGTFSGCTFMNNRASTGGGVQVIDASASLFNCTVSGNVASIAGGGINFQTVDGRLSQALTLRNSTIAYNQSPGTGALVVNAADSITAITHIGSSIIANNIGASLSETNGPYVQMDDEGFNLASDGANGLLPGATNLLNTNPKLGPLLLNGGTTPTHALLGGSPALDKGNDFGVTHDQRNATRPFTIAGLTAPAGGDHSDIGAVEMHAIIVTSAASSGAGTLNAAIAAANGNGTGLDDIVFASPLFDTAQTIDLLAALPLIGSSVTINGPAANLLAVRRDDTAPTFGIFRNTVSGLNIAISGMTISNGHNLNGFNGQDGNGGGIESWSHLALSHVDVGGNYADFGGGVVLLGGNGVFSDSTVSGNNGHGAGGGIYFDGQGAGLRVTNTTVSGNAAGAGIIALCEGGMCTLDIVNSTIVNNISVNGGGVETIAQFGDMTTRLRNCIVANNSPFNLFAQHSAGDTASVISLGFNLTSDDGAGFLVGPGDQINAEPKLAPLDYYGAPVRTHALLDTSPALDAGDSSGSTADERGFGFPRPVNLGISGSPPGDAADIGAWEAQSRDLLFINGFGTD